MITDTFKFDWYWDDTHSSYDGEKAFTKIIRQRLILSFTLLHQSHL